MVVKKGGLQARGGGGWEWAACTHRCSPPPDAICTAVMWVGGGLSDLDLQGLVKTAMSLLLIPAT